MGAEPRRTRDPPFKEPTIGKTQHGVGAFLRSPPTQKNVHFFVLTACKAHT